MFRLGSVRVRLTALVVLVSAIIAVLAATIGADRVQRSLVDDVLDEAALEQVGFLEEVILFDGGLVDTDDVFFESEIDFLPLLVADLDDVGALDDLLAVGGTNRSSGLPVLTNFGRIVLVGIDGAPTVVLDDDVESFDRVLVAQVTLDSLSASLFDPELNEIFGTENLDEIPEVFESFESPELEPGEATFEFARRTVGGVEFVVGAEVTDVERSVDRIRDVLWAAAPVLMLAAGLVTWLLTRRALRPVQRMTERLGEISAGNLHERVPEPGTGDEIDKLATTMNGMLDRLETDDTRLRRFVSDASHELRSPVAVMRSEAEVALRRPDDTDVSQLAEGMVAETQRLQRIVEDLLVLARGHERQGAIGFGPVDLDDVVLEEAARRRRVPVDVHEVSAGRVRGTRDACGRIVAHLLDNAARHANTTAAVGLTASDGTVVLWVDDDGPGIGSQDRERIFERFTRLEEARTRDTGGAGLGLAVVADTAEALGGSVEVADAPIGGARFILRLPSDFSSSDGNDGVDLP